MAAGGGGRGDVRRREGSGVECGEGRMRYFKRGENKEGDADE
jgi:hypothetical protein